MSYHRKQTRPDSNQAEIVETLRKAGVLVWIIGQPCDLLTFYKGNWLCLEVKSTKRPRKDQEAQDKFLLLTNTPKVTTALEALSAVTLKFFDRRV